MNSLVIFGSRSGNTERIAAAIAEALKSNGPVRLAAVDESPQTLSAGVDLLVVGGPTEGHGMTAPVANYLRRLEPGTLGTTRVAAFDTRLRWPGWLAGSAAVGIMRRLRAAGGIEVSDPQSFFVGGKPPTLEPGELERAGAWGAALAAEARQHPAGAAAAEASAGLDLTRVIL
jgi:flavodoxin